MVFRQLERRRLTFGKSRLRLALSWSGSLRFARRGGATYLVAIPRR